MLPPQTPSSAIAAIDLFAWLQRAIAPDGGKAIQGQALGGSKSRLLRYEEGCADEEPSQVRYKVNPSMREELDFIREAIDLDSGIEFRTSNTTRPPDSKDAIRKNVW